MNINLYGGNNLMIKKEGFLFLIILILFIIIPVSFASGNETVEIDSINQDNLVSSDLPSEIHVDISGSDDNDGGVDNPVATITKAINISSNNSKIIIHEGIYKENNINITKSLEISAVEQFMLEMQLQLLITQNLLITLL